MKQSIFSKLSRLVSPEKLQEERSNKAIYKRFTKPQKRAEDIRRIQEYEQKNRLAEAQARVQARAERDNAYKVKQQSLKAVKEYTQAEDLDAKEILALASREVKFRPPNKLEKVRRYLSNVGGGFASDTRQITNKMDSYRNRRVPQRITQAIAGVGGVRVPYASSGRGKGYGRRGRPKGAYDSRYAAYGGVYGYRKALAQANRMRLLQEQQKMQQMMRNGQITPQQYVQMQQAQQQMPSQAPEMAYNEKMSQQMSENFSGPSSQPLPAPVQQNPQFNPQLQQSQTGVSLWDNSFMKLDSGQSNIPKQNGGAMWGAFNPETPSGEPGSDYYTEPDFFSGKQVLRRRSGDKLFKW